MIINLCLVFNKILYCSPNSVHHSSQLDVNNNNWFVCYSTVYLFYINNNNCYKTVRLMFATENFKPRLMSSNTPRLYLKLTELHLLTKKVRLMFATENFKPRLLSSNTPRLYSKLTELHSLTKNNCVSTLWTGNISLIIHDDWWMSFNHYSISYRK